VSSFLPFWFAPKTTIPHHFYFVKGLSKNFLQAFTPVCIYLYIEKIEERRIESRSRFRSPRSKKNISHKSLTGADGRGTLVLEYGCSLRWVNKIFFMSIYFLPKNFTEISELPPRKEKKKTPKAIRLFLRISETKTIKLKFWHQRKKMGKWGARDCVCVMVLLTTHNGAALDSLKFFWQEAICNPEDKFDYKQGCIIALQKLFGRLSEYVPHYLIAVLMMKVRQKIKEREKKNK